MVGKWMTPAFGHFRWLFSGGNLVETKHCDACDR
jgi:hypothetical protein